MSEPEELILEGAHVATRIARDVWRRHTRPPEPDGVLLVGIQTRLELLVAALFGRSIPICAVEAPAPRTWLSRFASSRVHQSEPALCANDGARVYLAPILALRDDREQALDMYRLLAVQQAARIDRGSGHALAALEGDRLRDLFRVADAAAIDRWTALNTGGLIGALVRARADALGHRGRGDATRSPLDRLIGDLLGSDPRHLPEGLPPDASAEACVTWAKHAAQSSTTQRRYHPPLPVSYWGEWVDPSSLHLTAWQRGGDEPRPLRSRQPRVVDMRRRPRVREAADDEDDASPGSWIIRADEPQESVEDPFGLQRPADRDQHADPEGLGDSLSELPEARVVRTREAAREILRTEDRPEPSERDGSTAAERTGAISYPEWDYRTNQFRQRGAIVREPVPALGNEAWAASRLSRHAGLVRRVRRRFDRLRPRPVRLFRQIDGAEIDISAYVRAAADRQAGVTMDSGLYVASRAVRRELAVAILMDASASTDGWVSATGRIIDVEKDAMLVVCEALDALGDRYALFAFSGEGADRVDVMPLKLFSEPSGSRTRRRLAAVDSDGYTRLGAAIRHVTAALGREPAAARLLLLVSDGKPNDIDVYEGRYGIEDTRQAVAEARRQGLTVFCLTVDREAPRYAARIFGPAGFAMLHEPQQLPRVVVEVLRQMIRV